MAVGPFTVSKERSEAVDFTTAFQQESLGILTATPKEASSQFQFLEPFNRDVRLSVVASLLTAGLASVFISLKTLHQAPRESNDQHLELERSISENILLTISSFFEQGLLKLEKGTKKTQLRYLC